MTQSISQFVLEYTFTRELYRPDREGNPTRTTTTDGNITNEEQIFV